jgi:hypothetical protein
VSLLHGLSRSLSVLIGSVEALRRQDADADSDIARVLQQTTRAKIVYDELAQVIEIVKRYKAAGDPGRLESDKPRAEEGARAA